MELMWKEPRPPEDPLEEGPRLATLRTIYISQMLTPITTQTYMPIVPLILTELLNESVLRVGQLFFALAFGSTLSFIAMPMLLGNVPTRTILLCEYALRAAMGLVWVYGLTPGADGELDKRTTLTCLFVSRFVYGLTLNSFFIPFPWVGARMPFAEKPQAIAYITQLVWLGIMLGPMVGIGVSGFVSDRLYGYRLIGWFTVASSSLLLATTYWGFQDWAVLARAKRDVAGGAKAATGESEEELRQWEERARALARYNVVNQFFQQASFLSGFEATLTLQVRQAYGWDLAESMKAWLPMAIFGVSFQALVTPRLIDGNNPARVFLGGFSWQWGSLLGVNWINLANPIPAWWFCVEGIFGQGGSIGTAAVGTVINQRLPVAEQILMQSRVGIASQVGRAVGPLVATYVFNLGNQVFPGSRGGGPNFSRIYMLVASTACAWYIVCHLSSLLGGLHAPSPKEKRERAAAQAAGGDKDKDKAAEGKGEGGGGMGGGGKGKAKAKAETKTMV